MDPVQLMMAAHQADATVAAQTPDQALQAAIAQSRPDLWAPLSTNPAAYPDLLGWLASTGNVEVLANLRARGYLTDDAAASAAGGVGDAGAAAAADSAAGEPTVDPAFSQGDPAQTEPTESAESAGDGGTPVDEDEAADEPGPVDGDEVEGVAGADSGEAGDAQKTDEPAEDSEGAEDAETESQASQDQHVEDAAVDESADERGAEPADEAEEPGTDEPAEDSGAAEAAAEPDAEDSAEETTDADDSGEVGDEQKMDEPAGDSNAAETAAEPDAEPEVADEVAADADEVRESGTDQPEDEASGEQAVEETAVDESADERDAATAATELDAEDAAVDAGSGEVGDEQKMDEPAEGSDAAEAATDPDAEGVVDEAADSDNNDTTVLAPDSQWHEVDSADTTDVTASAQSAAVSSGWTAGSAAPAAGSAESVAFPVPPPPSAEDIAAWAETPSGAPSGFSAAQPAVELDMFGPQMVAQMPPPQQKQPSKSSSGRLVAIIVVLLLVIVGGGGLWAGSYFANKDKSGDTSQDKADSNGGEDGKQNGQADAAATSTAAALPSGAVKACSSMPTFTITSVEDGQGELKVHGNMATSCAEGDFLAGSSSQVLVYSSTSPTGGADVDHLVASGTFDLSSDPLIIPNGGRAVTLRFGEQHYFRTAKDLDLKGLTVRPSFDRGSSSTATAKSSTNSAMTIASSASSNANQEAQDEQAAGDAIQWQIKHDYPIVMNSLRGKWTPQLSSKQVGLVADGQTWTKRSILAEYLKTQQANPKAVIIDTSQWPVYDTGGWWVTLQGDTYSDGDQANAWCDAQGYDSDHCLAKRIESNGTSQGTTKLR
ncbi:variant leucine-rich repeat-containing protein [Actinomyces oris]|uniref:Leucine rich repeat variant domain-containing protein n=1 Tax=Actinomyces oris TaxID=544580 RepID=A0AAW8LBN5_9ACTO|nr:hypothetical protein [Actinomyces oris]MDR0177032.1 hypothetical protein [Actinomyces oris]